jgi:hypothetical protein
MIDFEAIDSAVGQNWYDLDPDLTARVVRDCPDDDLDWADAKLRDFGALVGSDIAVNADIIDANPPELVRYDRWADEVQEDHKVILRSVKLRPEKCWAGVAVNFRGHPSTE